VEGGTNHPTLATCGAGIQPELKTSTLIADVLPDAFTHSNPSKDMEPSEKALGSQQEREQLLGKELGRGSAPAEDHPMGEVPISARTAAS